MPISHQWRCIFVHIPKTAGTSIERALGILGDWKQENRRMMFGYSVAKLANGKELSSPFLQHLTARELNEILPDEIWSYFKFSFVRNPWDRIVSVYSNKDPHLCNLARAHGISIENTSFDDFVAKTIDLDHAHLRPQSDYIIDKNGVQLVDFIGRMEHLERDFTYICKQLGAQLALPRENISQRGNYRDYYSESSRKLVSLRYKTDIEMFNYQF